LAIKFPYHIYLIMKKDLTEFYRIKARLISMTMLPIILMLLFGYMFPAGGGVNHISIAVVQQDQTPAGLLLSDNFIYAAQSTKTFDVQTTTSLEWAENQITLGNIYGVVVFHQGVSDQLRSGSAQVEVVLDQVNPTLDQEVKGGITQIFLELQNNLSPSFTDGLPGNTGPTINLQFEGLVPGQQSSFEFLAPGMIAMTLIIGGLSGLAMTFSREKELGTLDGFLMTPISRVSIIFGKGLAQIVRGFLTSGLVFAISILLFGVHVYGNPFLMILVLMLGVTAFTGLGILATTFVNDQESAQLIIMMIQFPMIFLSGVLYPILQLPWFLKDIAALLPLTYVVSAFRAVMILNAPFQAIYTQVIVLIISTIVVYSIAIPLFRRSVMR
jgi:ABC-2 type transport system permease protein